MKTKVVLVKLAQKMRHSRQRGGKDEENPQSKQLEREVLFRSYEWQRHNTKYSSKLCLFATFSFLVDFPRLSLSLSNFHSKQHEFRHWLHKRPLACSHGKSTSLPIQVLFASSPLPACAHGARQDGMEKTQRKRVGKKRKKYTVFFLRYAGETRAGVLKHIFPFSPCCFLVDRRRS